MTRLPIRFERSFWNSSRLISEPGAARTSDQGFLEVIDRGLILSLEIEFVALTLYMHVNNSIGTSYVPAFELAGTLLILKHVVQELYTCLDD